MKYELEAVQVNILNTRAIKEFLGPSLVRIEKYDGMKIKVYFKEYEDVDNAAYDCDYIIKTLDGFETETKNVFENRYKRSVL